MDGCVDPGLLPALDVGDARKETPGGHGGDRRAWGGAGGSRSCAIAR